MNTVESGQRETEYFSDDTLARYFLSVKFGGDPVYNFRYGRHVEHDRCTASRGVSTNIARNNERRLATKRLNRLTIDYDIDRQRFVQGK